MQVKADVIKSVTEPELQAAAAYFFFNKAQIDRARR